jgi:hypothetical protein
LTRADELADHRGYDWLYLAMAHWQAGQPDEARGWQRQALEKIKQSNSIDAELTTLSAEVAGLLGTHNN